MIPAEANSLIKRSGKKERTLSKLLHPRLTVPMSKAAASEASRERLHSTRETGLNPAKSLNIKKSNNKPWEFVVCRVVITYYLNCPVFNKKF